MLTAQYDKTQVVVVFQRIPFKIKIIYKPHTGVILLITEMLLLGKFVPICLKMPVKKYIHVRWGGKWITFYVITFSDELR